MNDQCKMCRKWYPENRVHSQICEDCIDNFRHDYKLCYKMTKEAKEKESIEINSFLLSMFSPADIEEVLMDRLDECADDASVAEKATDCSEFIDEDICWFAEQLYKEVN